VKSPISPSLALLVLALGACQSSNSAKPQLPPAQAEVAEIEFTTLASGTRSGLREPLTRVVRTWFGFSELWKQHAAGTDLVPPGIDFTTEMVVVVALGERPSTGFSVSIERIVSDAGFLRVEARERELAGPAGAAMTQPFAMVRLARSTAPVQVKFLR
jgi:hypothetical protein